MNDEHLETIEQVKQFLEGSEKVEFKGLAVEEKYEWAERVLVRFGIQQHFPDIYRPDRAQSLITRRWISPTLQSRDTMKDRIVALRELCLPKAVGGNS